MAGLAVVSDDFAMVGAFTAKGAENKAVERNIIAKRCPIIVSVCREREREIKRNGATESKTEQALLY